MKSYYTQEAGKFHLHGQAQKRDESGTISRDAKGEIVMEDHVVFSSEQVVICYCKRDGKVSVLAHGSPEQMKAWLETHNQTVSKTNAKFAKNESGVRPPLVIDHTGASFLRATVPDELRGSKGWATHEDHPEAYAKTFDQSAPPEVLNRAIEDSLYFSTLL